MKGDIGDAGLEGQQGIQGPKGDPGLNGGRDGVNGEAGATGDAGATGPAGDAGIDNRLSKNWTCNTLTPNVVLGASFSSPIKISYHMSETTAGDVFAHAEVDVGADADASVGKSVNSTEFWPSGSGDAITGTVLFKMDLVPNAVVDIANMGTWTFLLNRATNSVAATYADTDMAAVYSVNVVCK
jgi:hypothetical protein